MEMKYEQWSEKAKQAQWWEWEKNECEVMVTWFSFKDIFSYRFYDSSRRFQL